MHKDFIEDVYHSALGVLTAPVLGIDDAFAPGEQCEIWYNLMLDACERLSCRLGTQYEDRDVETIRYTMECIQKELCKRMFCYGALFAQQKAQHSSFL